MLYLLQAKLFYRASWLDPLTSSLCWLELLYILFTQPWELFRAHSGSAVLADPIALK